MLRGFLLMFLLLGRTVSLSFVHRLTSCCPSTQSKPVVFSSVLIKLRGVTSVSGLLFGSASGQNSRTMPERRPFVRLPTDVCPVNYGLCLKPDLIDFTFEGKLEAQVEVRCSEVPGIVCVYVCTCARQGFCYVIANFIRC